MIKNCIICGKEFSTINPRQLSCSKECAKIRQKALGREWRKNNADIIRIRHRELYKRKHPLKKVTCQICGKIFWDNVARKYCVFCEEEAKRRRNKRYRVKHAAQIREYDRIYKKNHREHIRKVMRIWRSKNRLRIKIRRVLGSVKKKE